MNIYEKLQICRVALQEMNLKKTGHNTYSDYDYYELADFLPSINRLFLEYKMAGVVSFTKDLATLTIVDFDEPTSEIVFTSPMSTATLKACHEVQNLGAVESYERRYLYMTALEIVESDSLDGTNGKEQKQGAPPKQQSTQNKPSTTQPPELEKRATKIFYHFTGNKEGQLGWAVEDYKKQLKLWKEEGHISSDYGKKWTEKDIEWIEVQMTELPF